MPNNIQIKKIINYLHVNNSNLDPRIQGLINVFRCTLSLVTMAIFTKKELHSVM